MRTDSDQLLALCREAFPDRGDLAIHTVNSLPGNQHDHLAFHLHWHKGKKTGDRAMILRRYPAPSSRDRSHDPDRAGREMAVIQWLAGEGLPVPVIHASGADDEGGWLLMEAMPGHNWYLPLGGVNFGAVLPGLAAAQIGLLARLHSLTPPAELPLPRITAADVLAGWQEAAKSADDPLLAAALRQLGELMAGVEELPPDPLHGDAHLTNLLVGEDGSVVGWLDWDDTALGDPRWDVAAVVAALRRDYQMPELASRMVTVYGEKTVRPVRHLAMWLAVLGVGRWAGCAWLRAEARRGHEIDFPAQERFVENYDSHRAWAMEILQEAEAEINDG